MTYSRASSSTAAVGSAIRGRALPPTRRRPGGRTGVAGFLAVVLGLGAVGIAAPTASAAEPQGRVYAFGLNHKGQLGDGTRENRVTPAQSRLADRVTAVSVSEGGEFGLALGSDGNVYSWGSNLEGQLGTGVSADVKQPDPQQIDGLPDGEITAVSAGDAFGLAAARDGSVYAWGSNSFGQLGDGTTNRRDTPVEVTGLPTGATAIALAAGTDHALAVMSNGTTYAWGANSQGQLGDGTRTHRTTAVPVVLPADTRFTAVAAGEQHSLAYGTDGQVYSWGSNTEGQLGDGSTESHPTPQAVAALSAERVEALAAGAFHSLVATADGRVLAWGFNRYGQLGDGSTTDRAMPVEVTDLPRSAVSLDGGRHTSAAVLADGTAWAWGRNDYGQVGDSTTESPRTAPVKIAVPADVSVSQVSLGQYAGLVREKPAPAPEVPSAPRGVTAQAGDGTIAVSWQPPADDGGAAITDYVVAAARPGWVTVNDATEELSSTLQRLENGAPYTVTVFARNSAGSGPASAPITVTPVFPAASVTASGGNNQAATVNAMFAAPLQATVKNEAGAVVSGAAVTFSIDGPATFSGGKTTSTAATNSQGVATSPALTAGRTAGTVTISATTPSGTGTPVGTQFVAAVTAAGSAQADLSVVVSAPASLKPGGATGTVSVKVTNNGPSTATGVLTSLYVAKDLTVAGGGSSTYGVVFFRTASLASKASATYPVTVRTGKAKSTAALLAGTLSGTRDPKLLNNLGAASVPIT